MAGFKTCEQQFQQFINSAETGVRNQPFPTIFKVFEPPSW